MKLRMYLRGLGLGLMVAALVTSLSVKTDNKTMTDAQIKERAAELGMVEQQTTLKDPKETNKPDEAIKVELEPVEEKASEIVESEEAEEKVESEQEAEQETEEAEKADAQETEQEVAKSEQSEEEATKKAEEEAAKKAEEEAKKKTYTLTIAKGYSSDRVANILKDAGVIDSAAAFDKYLCDHRYDNKISTGTYNIPAGADYETIARLITGNR